MNENLNANSWYKSSAEFSPFSLSLCERIFYFTRKISRAPPATISNIEKCQVKIRISILIETMQKSAVFFRPHLVWMSCAVCNDIFFYLNWNSHSNESELSSCRIVQTKREKLCKRFQWYDQRLRSGKRCNESRFFFFLRLRFTWNWV